MFRAVGRFIAGMLLVVFLLLCIVVSVVAYSLDRATVLELASASAGEAFVEEVRERSDESNLNDVYAQFLAECDRVGGGTVTLGETGIEASCSEIRRVGASGIEDYILEQFEVQAQEATRQQLVSSELGPIIEYILTFGRATALVLGGVVLVLLFLLFMLSVPKYHFVVDLGFVALLVGAPMFILPQIDVSVPYTWASSINEFAQNIVSTLHSTFLVTFILGILLTGFGFFIRYTHLHASTKQEKTKA